MSHTDGVIKGVKSLNAMFVVNSLYNPISIQEVIQKYLNIKPKLLYAVVENKVDFLEFISDIVINKNEMKSYATSIDACKCIVMNFDNLSTNLLNNLLTDGKLKHFAIIKFLKDYCKHPIIGLYKKQVVDALVASASRLVVKLAKETNITLPFEDKIMLGLEGLVDAAWRYEPYKGFAFTTYARWWILQRLYTGIETDLKIPSSQLMKFHKLYDKYKQYKNETNNTDIDGFVRWLEENNETVTLDSTTIKQILQVTQTVSYEEISSEYENRTSDDFISEENSVLYDITFKRFEEDFEQREYMCKFEEIVRNVLSPLEFSIFYTIVFSPEEKKLTRKEICRKFNLKSPQDVDKIYKRAVKKLRKIFPSKTALLELKPKFILHNQVL